MENRSFYKEILTEHNMHPDFKHDIPDADIVLDGVNPSCGDEIQLKLKTDGDIITDEAGAVVGGVGYSASGCINASNEYPSMFEPIHGSAPDIAGQNKANPTAAILSAAMLLRPNAMECSSRSMESKTFRMSGRIFRALAVGIRLVPFFSRREKPTSSSKLLIM